MLRKTLVAAVLALTLPALTARAQIGFGAAAGASVPIGDFGKSVETGYHATGIVTVSAPLAPVGLRIEASFGEFGFKSSLAGNSKQRLISGTANVMFSSPGLLGGPYGIGGLGIYNMKTTSCTTCSSGTSKVGFNIGAGYRAGLAGFSAFVEARYHHIPVTGGSNQFIPISFGVTF